MKTKQFKKSAFLLGALGMFIMIPVYCFFIMEDSNLAWLPVLLLLACGTLSLVNYFIMHIEHIRRQRILVERTKMADDNNEILNKVA